MSGKALAKTRFHGTVIIVCCTSALPLKLPAAGASPLTLPTNGLTFTAGQPLAAPIFFTKHHHT